MDNPSNIKLLSGRKIATIILALLFFTVVAFTQDKPQSNSHSSHKEGEAHLQDGSHDHSSHKKADTKMSCSQESASKNCCSSESNTINEAKAEPEKSWNAVCPVMGNEIDTEVKTVKYKEKTIGFCCPGCINKFNKDPEKYMSKLSKDGKKKISS